MLVRVASKSQLKSGEGKTVSANGVPIALFNVGGEFYAIDNTCAHRGGPLGDGMLSGANVTCPWHGWEYDIKTGKCLTLAQVQLRTFKTKVEGDDIFVEI